MSRHLEIHEINTFYGVSHILFGASLFVKEKEVVFLLGRNGVGKTTTLLSIMGFPSPRSGKIIFMGKEIQNLPTHEIARLGIVLVPEGRRILAGLSVDENLQIAGMKRKDHTGKWALERIYKLFPRLCNRKEQVAITLSGGEQQMLAIARGLMSNPGVLLVDAPVEGLAPLVAKTVGEILLELKNEGVTMLCADDDLRLASHAADRIYFMDQGRIVWDGTTKEVSNGGKEVVKKYLSVG